MLTVKIVSLNGHEIVREAECVVLYPSNESNDGTSHLMVFKSLNADQGDEDIIQGHVYVMNENGKTIANYHLFPPQPVFEPFTKEQEEQLNKIMDN